MKKLTLKSARRLRKIRRRPINVLASAVTITGLYFGIASIFHSIDQNYKDAAYFILLAMLCDIFDGSVAKLTNSVSEFGKELDSLCDLVSFGAAPAVLIYTAYLAEERMGGSVFGKAGAVIAIIYVICSALRLARYNIYQSHIRDYFRRNFDPAAPAYDDIVKADYSTRQIININLTLQRYVTPEADPSDPDVLIIPADATLDRVSMQDQVRARNLGR